MFTRSFNVKGSVLKLILLSSVLLNGCDDSNNNDSDNVNCPDVVSPALTIEVKDKNTGDFIGCGATVIIEDTGYSEEVINEVTGSCDNSTLYQGAYERDGVYDVHVSQEGYLDWSTYSVEVTSGVCGVSTVHLIAELEK